jgi:hypothetical protein
VWVLHGILDQPRVAKGILSSADPVIFLPIRVLIEMDISLRRLFYSAACLLQSEKPGSVTALFID